MTACWRSARRWRTVYRRWGWGDRVWTWHEAADTRLFHPPAQRRRAARASSGSAIGAMASARSEIEDFLLRPAASRRSAARHLWRALSRRGAGDARSAMARAIAAGRPTPRAPEIFARHLATVHVPRRYYATILPGIPTIRVFEALACGIPLVSAPWDDAEQLFRPGTDYLVAAERRSDDAASSRDLRDDPALRAALAASGAGDDPRPPHLRPPRRRAAGHRRHARRAPRSKGTWREDRLLRIEPAVVLLERRRDLLSRHPARSRRARLRHHLLRTRRVRPAAASRHRPAGLGALGRLSGDRRRRCAACWPRPATPTSS